MTVQMARIEGQFPVLYGLQLVGATMLSLLFMICNLIWTIAAFRPEQHVQILQMLHDAGWLIFVMAIPEYWMQLVCLAVVFLGDKRQKPFISRWACFFTLMVAVVGGGGALATFFKTGPWAYNGLIGFWMPIGFYVVWICVMFPLFIKGVKRQELIERN